MQIKKAARVREGRDSSKKIECVREGTCFSSPVNFAVVSAAVAFLGNVKGKEIKKAETPK